MIPVSVIFKIITLIKESPTGRKLGKSGHPEAQEKCSFPEFRVDVLIGFRW
jgi:hypothetical protein